MEENAKKDFAYCSGIKCKIKNRCTHYLAEPPRDETLMWLDPAYSKVINDCIFFVKKKPLKETEMDWVQTSHYASRSRLYRYYAAEYGNEVVNKIVTTSIVTNSNFVGSTRYAFANKIFKSFDQMTEYIENRKYTSRNTNRKKKR